MKLASGKRESIQLVLVSNTLAVLEGTTMARLPWQQHWSEGDFYCPVEMELFMPEDWEDDQERRLRAGIPDWKRHESKTVMALRMVKQLFKRLTADVECVGFDALYGKLHSKGIRQGTKGTLTARYHMRKVLGIAHPTKTFLELHLLIRECGDGRTKYALGYFPGKINIKRMAKAQAQRVFVECIFEEGKNITGLADYQVRSLDRISSPCSLIFISFAVYNGTKHLLKNTNKKITAYNIQELVNATIITISTLDHVIKKLAK